MDGRYLNAGPLKQVQAVTTGIYIEGVHHPLPTTVVICAAILPVAWALTVTVFRRSRASRPLIIGGLGFATVGFIGVLPAALFGDPRWMFVCGFWVLTGLSVAIWGVGIRTAYPPRG